jgi:hypothetical protein
MSDTKWIAEEDWTKVKRGDLVKLQNQEALIIMPAIKDSLGHAISYRHGSVQRNDGWSLFVEAPPAVVLPTEPGYYSVGRKAHPYERLLVLREQWFELSAAGQSTDGYYTPNRLAEIAVRENRLTRLEPVPETAKKVLDAAMETSLATPDSYWAQILSDVALEFGVK